MENVIKKISFLLLNILIATSAHAGQTDISMPDKHPAAVELNPDGTVHHEMKLPNGENVMDLLKRKDPQFFEENPSRENTINNALGQQNKQ